MSEAVYEVFPELEVSYSPPEPQGTVATEMRPEQAPSEMQIGTVALRTYRLRAVERLNGGAPCGDEEAPKTLYAVAMEAYAGLGRKPQQLHNASKLFADVQRLRLLRPSQIDETRLTEEERLQIAFIRSPHFSVIPFALSLEDEDATLGIGVAYTGGLIRKLTTPMRSTAAGQAESPADTAPAVTPEDWQKQASCRQSDKEIFFPVRGDARKAAKIKEAKRLCVGCVVRAECLEYALENDEPFGIWGGLTEHERRKLKYRQGRQ